jgi:hypothetical protein
MFNLEIKTVAALPATIRSGGPKYDWSKFPAPTEGAIPTAFIPDVVSNTISGSIKKYRERLENGGMKKDDLPAFRIETVKSEDGKKVTGVNVYRVK